MPLIYLTNPLTDPTWDAKVATLPGATIFHTAAWARVLQQTYSYEPCYFALGDSVAPQGIIPLMGIRSWLTGKRGVSLPFTDECAPLSHDPASLDVLVGAARKHGQARGWKTIEFRGGSSFFSGQAAYQPSTSYWCHRLSLSSDESALFARVESSNRRAIRKSETNHLQIEISNSLSGMQAFYHLMCLTRQRHGLPPQSWAFFVNLHKHVLNVGHGCVIIARLAATAVAGAVFLHSGKRTLYKYGASDDTQQHLRANNLVMWNGIKWHAQRGFTSLDFGRTSLGNEGLRRFKLSWGTEEYRLDYTKLDLGTDKYVSAPDRASGWHSRIFQKMPLPLARLIGAALYRHMA